jgi:NAD(P)-dependent dehydrogenase (short-subunit alcohol dehydrogenase family)
MADVAPPTSTSELFSVDGKVVVITGGTRGIGRMIATGFVQGGATVIVSSRKSDACAATADELSSYGSCTGIAADLSTEAGAEGLAQAVGALHDHVDVLVNNAGATWGVPLADHDTDSWNRVLDLNVQGVFHATKFFLPLLQARASADAPARVINIGSIDGLRAPVMETYSYGASKAAVHHLTRHLAKHLAPTVTVNAIAPGPFESKMMAATLDAFGEQIAATTPMRRIGRPDDMAGAALYLASRAGAYVTGTVLAVDGGISTTA